MNILYEDNHIIVVVKPQNIPTQEDSSKDKDMLTMVKEYIKEKYEKPGNVYVGLVHRLDRPTGGVMVFAKTSKAASRLVEQIKDGQMQKQYLAVIHGVPKEVHKTCIDYLKKNEKTNTVTVEPESVYGAKYSELSYDLLENNQKYSLIKVNLVTGRSHQIRVQLSHRFFPIVGDQKYGKKEKCNLALWAYELKFYHPITKKLLTFKAYPPIQESPWKMFQVEKFLLS